MAKRNGLSSAVVGLISDTHGLLRPEAVEALRNVDLILHAGDIGHADVLEELKSVAPVIAVRGNNDFGAWARDIPERQHVEVGHISIYMLHDMNELELDPVAAGYSAVVSGHSHKPVVTNHNDVLYVNPGSAGPRRFTLPISVGKLEVNEHVVTATLLTLAA